MYLRTCAWCVCVLSCAFIGNDEENWCLTRSQDTPSSLSEFSQPIDQMFNVNQDQDGTVFNVGGFDVLQPLSVTTLFLIVAIIKLLF